MLLVCEEEGLLGGTHFAIDGYKLSSNAGKEWSGTHADLRQKHTKLRELVRQSVREHRRNDRDKSAPAQKSIERMKRLEQKAARIERFLQENQPRQGRMGKEVQSNVTDNESAKMKSSHGIIQGYNANAMVDAKHQVIVHAQAFGEGDDGAIAEPMVKGAKANLAAAGCAETMLQQAVVSADTGYFSNRNLEAFAALKIDAYVPDPKFRQRDPRLTDARRHRRPTDRYKQQYKSKRRWFGPEDFKYEAKTQRLICPAGKRLYGTGREVSSAQGYLVSHYKGHPVIVANARTLRAICSPIRPRVGTRSARPSLRFGPRLRRDHLRAAALRRRARRSPTARTRRCSRVSAAPTRSC